MERLLYTTPEISIIVMECDVLAGPSPEAGEGYDSGLWG
jgi:hypothetical protein